MNHVIKTQILAVQIQQQEGAFTIQQQIRDLFYHVILPVLEKAFDEICPVDEVIRLDRFEIDLGMVTINDLEGLDLTEVLKKKIQEQISEITLLPHKTSKPTRPLRLTVVEQWIFYMQRGYLPWNLKNLNPEWYHQVLEAFACESASIAMLRKLVSTDARAVKRIVFLHTQSFMVHLTEALTSEKQSDLDQAIVIIGKILADSDKQNETIQFQRSAWQEILRIASHETSLKSSEIIQRVLPWQLKIPELLLLKENRHHAPDLVDLILKVRASEETPPVLDRRAKSVHSAIAEAPIQNKNLFPDEGLFVQNAGLVLLHPFLFNLFKYLGLLEEKDFKSNSHRQRALVVLHFLSTGSSTYEEHELVVAKLFCNHPLEDPVDPDIKLSNDEQVECIELLKEVIARWSILKNTSPDTLRANFLQRNGKLYTRLDEPHLLMESNMLDVLLDHLPWGIGIVKLPWMNQLLKVEWR
jgi:hypothetical protein